jgi:hypothetical protein
MSYKSLDKTKQSRQRGKTSEKKNEKVIFLLYKKNGGF